MTFTHGYIIIYPSLRETQIGTIMKECQIIEIKTTTRALQGGRDDIEFASMHMRDDIFRCHEDGAMIQPMGKIDTERRRVVQLKRHTAHRTDTTYVVWSPEVEALLSTPLDMINEFSIKSYLYKIFWDVYIFGLKDIYAIYVPIPDF